MKQINKKNILIVDELCYPMLGGQQLHLKSLAEFWVQKEHSVTIIAIDHVGTLPFEEELNGVTINRLIKDSSYYKRGILGRNLATIFLYTFHVIKYARKNNKKFDIIIFNQFPVLPALISKFIFPRQIRVLDFVEHRSGLMWKCINYFLLNSTSKVICISDYLKKQVLSYRKKNVFSVYNCIDTSQLIFNSQEFKKKYLFFGRMESHKHPEDAIRTVIHLREHFGNECSIKVVGGGTLLEELKEKYKNYSYIRFSGRVSDEEKIAILSQSNILILPSEREGLPNVVLESICFGIPVVTTDYPDNGTKYFVKDFSIGLVANPNIEDIADKVIEIEKNYDYFSKNCLKNKSRFDVTKIGLDYINTVVNE